MQAVVLRAIRVFLLAGQVPWSIGIVAQARGVNNDGHPAAGSEDPAARDAAGGGDGAEVTRCHILGAGVKFLVSR